MKTTTMIIIYVMLIAACVGMTREELEQEATETGDWSKIERIERREAEERTYQEMSNFCQVRKQMLVCNDSGKMERCGCVDRNAIRGIL